MSWAGLAPGILVHFTKSHWRFNEGFLKSFEMLQLPRYKKLVSVLFWSRPVDLLFVERVEARQPLLAPPLPSVCQTTGSSGPTWQRASQTASHPSRDTVCISRQFSVVRSGDQAGEQCTTRQQPISPEWWAGLPTQIPAGTSKPSRLLLATPRPLPGMGLVVPQFLEFC